jgi:hypothetical protein
MLIPALVSIASEGESSKWCGRMTCLEQAWVKNSGARTILYVLAIGAVEHADWMRCGELACVILQVRIAAPSQSPLPSG